MILMIKKTAIVILTSGYFFLFLGSCDMENFSTEANLNPTLLLSLSNTTGGDLAVTFTAQNSQDYCKGYTIYLGDSFTKVTNHSYPLSNSSGNLPTVDRTETITTTYTYIISNNNSGLNSGGAFPSPCYIGVAAWGYDNIDYVISPIVIVSNF